MISFNANSLCYQEYKPTQMKRESGVDIASGGGSIPIRYRIRNNRRVIEELNNYVVRQKTALYKFISNLVYNFYAEDILLQQAQSAVQLTISALNEERRQAERSHDEIRRRLIADYKMLIKEQQEGERIWMSKLHRFDE